MKTSVLLTHFVAAIIVSAINLLIYASVQQCFRSSANDPQLQIARDISNAISSGKSFTNLLPHNTIDITQSLAVFVALYDKKGNPIQSTGLLNDALPNLPQGIYQFTGRNQEDAITWQPQLSVRMAMVIEKVNAANVGFVAVGRSLKEVEVRESNLLRMVEIIWFVCMAILLAHSLIQYYLNRKLFNK